MHEFMNRFESPMPHQQNDVKNTESSENSESWVRRISLPEPSLKDNTGDADRLSAALKRELKTDHPVEIDLQLMRLLPDYIRHWSYKLKCILFKNRGKYVLAGVCDGNGTQPVAGLAVDLGTSRVVARLINLESKETLAESAFDNPQAAVGPDILVRIHHADTSSGLEELNSLIISALNRTIKKLCKECAMETTDIFLVIVSGNTAMTHLFLKLNPHWIIREPYIPAANRPPLIKAAELGISVNPTGKLMVFPNIGSYFGGDLISGILYSGIHLQEETSIMVDVGTNAEVVLGNKHWLIACAGAAGPALEGGVTRMGMMAEPGVIDQVKIDPETLDFKIHTIEDKPPVGICGSGLIDLAANLFSSKMIDIRGKFTPSICGNRLKEKDDIFYLIIVPEAESGTGKALTISQPDLESLIRSKAAMFTILETITNTVGMTLEELSAFYVAGTFGSFINPASAITIGMLPDLPIESYQPLGNSSLGGATLVLTNPRGLDEIDVIRDRITYMELNVNQDFMNRFSAAKFLPHTDPFRFPSVPPQ